MVRLKIKDIDSNRMLIHVRGSKGRKDRYTILSKTVLYTLRQYWEKYQPQDWLFEGAKPQSHISVRTAQKIFEQAYIKSG